MAQQEHNVPVTQLPSTQDKLANYETVFTNAKAGMAGVNKEHVKRIVYEMSKDSPHFKNEQRKQAQTDVRIQKLRSKAKAITQAELAASSKAMDRKVLALEATRDLTHVWAHVDMDAFYASCEELADPSLKSKSMAVGGIGMVCTANYNARKFGIRAAMPGFIARRLCPDLVFVKPDFQKYTTASQATRAIFRAFDPDFEAGSLDEAYLDLTNYCRDHGMTGGEVAEEMRLRVQRETHLTCSVGIGPNGMLAKVASDINKPNGQYVLPQDPAALKQFVQTLSLRKVPGIGKVGEQTLKALGMEVCADLVANRGLINLLFSPVATDSFLSAGLGLGRTVHGQPPNEGEVNRKGISCERTFAAISSAADLESKCMEIAEHLAGDMAREDLKGKTLTLKLKTTAFEVRTRAHSLPQYISTYEEIFTAAMRLLKAEMPIEIRLMGMRMSNFLEVRKEAGQKSIASFVQATPATTSAAGTVVTDKQGAFHVPSSEGPTCPDATPSNDTVRDQTGNIALDEMDDLTDLEHMDVWDRLHDTDAATNDPLREHSEFLDVGRASVPHDRPHWQDDYATNWDRVGMNRHESTSDATANAMQHVLGQAALDHDDESLPVSGKSKVWICKLCTYADNPSHSIRCEICDTTRGSRLQDVPYAKATANFKREGVGTKSGAQAVPPAGAFGSHDLHSRPATFDVQADTAGNSERRQPQGSSKRGRPKASSKRSQQSISGFLGAPAAAKRPSPSVQSDLCNSSRSSPQSTDAKWQCHRCKQWFHLGEQAEHNDYHVALDLHAQTLGSDRSFVGSLQHCKSNASYLCELLRPSSSNQATACTLLASCTHPYQLV